jgi:hypothetical protein
MAQSVPKEVIARALRNQPANSQTSPRFKSADWYARFGPGSGASSLSIAPSDEPDTIPNNALTYNGVPITYLSQYLVY